jgi:sedoheptulokinase
MDYVVMKLAGKKEPVTDHSNGAGLGFFDVGNLSFDHRAMERVGIDASIVPDIDSSGSRFGYYYKKRNLCLTFVSIVSSCKKTLPFR